MTRRLVLFDVDGTLVDVRGAGRRAFADALREAWAIEDALERVSFAGATDLGVLDRVLASRVPEAASRARASSSESPSSPSRASPPAQFAAFFAAMERALAAHLAREPPGVVDGARALMASLDAVAAPRGLVTGNARACARVKLRAAGLDEAFAAHGYACAGYGDEHPDRDELARIALRRAVDAHGAFDEVVLIGDTPSDVAAARASGATAIGVARDDERARALTDAGARVVVRRLDDEDVLRIVRR